MISQYALVLCGGSGSRLWPISRDDSPKQFIELIEEGTLFHNTLERISQIIPADNIYIVTQIAYEYEVKRRLAESFPDLIKNVIVEPVGRNTLPAISLSVKRIVELDPNAILSVFPSDHLIKNQEAFTASWNAAIKAANLDYLSIFGSKPTFPSTGFGYIEPSENLVIKNLDSVFEVKKFHEKPTFDKAAQYIQDGFLWNCGIFVFKVNLFMQLLAQYQPEIYSRLELIKHAPSLAEYELMPNLSIDYGLIEKIPKIAVVAVEMGWKDLGSWNSLYESMTMDLDENVVHGNVVAIDSRRSLFWSDSATIASLGVDNLVVVFTRDYLLVCSRDRTEDVKMLLSKVQNSSSRSGQNHSIVYRPWGTYIVLEEGAGFKVKKIVVYPGKYISLQKHIHRSEHWVVVSGVAKIINGNTSQILHENESTFIPKGEVHQLINHGNKYLEIIEVQSGSYLGEDDIERFDCFPS